jgi:hypothetical protein
MADTTPIGGLVSFRVDDSTFSVADGSDVTFAPTQTKAESVPSLMGTAGYSEVPVVQFIEAEVLCTPEQYAVLVAKRDATVTASNRAGASCAGSGMWFAGDPSYAMNAGKATVRFEGKRVDVVPA